MPKVLLWLDSLIEVGDADQTSICEFLFEARNYFVTHQGRMEGFKFPVADKAWYELLLPPFKVNANPGCRLWKLSLDANITQALSETIPNGGILKDGRKGMDVFEVWQPEGVYPVWFVVFQTSVSKLVCLAGECSKI